jgi:hypothetical protein
MIIIVLSGLIKGIFRYMVLISMSIFAAVLVFLVLKLKLNHKLAIAIAMVANLIASFFMGYALGQVIGTTIVFFTMNPIYFWIGLAAIPVSIILTQSFYAVRRWWITRNDYQIIECEVIA